MTLPSADDLLGGGGAAGLKFETVGTSYTGTVKAYEARPITNLDTGVVEVWPDGTVKQQIVVTLQTDLRDPAVEDDDGTRRLFCKSNLFTALRQAVAKAGTRSLEVGGKLTVTHIGLGERAKAHLSPPKLFSMTFTPAVAAALEQPAAAPAPASTPAPAAAAAPPSAEEIAALQARLAELQPQQ